MIDSKKTVLVVEDEPALQEAVKIKLEKEGVNVLTADTGEDAIIILETNKPDLVWLDILLPCINGIEVLEKIRENPKLKNLPAVIVSVSGGQEKIKRAFSLGVVDYLIKSEYTIDVIIGKVKNLLNDL